MRATAFLIVLLCAAAAGSGARAQPSFDCTAAANPVEELLCSDQQPAALDRELARLYRLALAEPQLSPAALAELKATQRGWIKGRDECWKADDLRGCVVSNYGIRILELRQGYSNARTRDDEGISTGPVSLACEGLDFGIGVVFISPDPSIVAMSFLDTAVTLVQQIAASGVRYEGDAWDGHYLLWTKGNEAQLELPGRASTTCRIEEIG
jgi:uncharacterized protein